MSVLSQPQISGYDNLYAYGPNRAGERFNAWPASTISRVDVSLYKLSTPTGIAYCRVRQVSDDALLGTLGSIDVATLSAFPAWKTFNTTPVIVPSAQDIRIMMEFAGGSSSKRLLMSIYGAGSVYAGGVYTHWNPYVDYPLYEWAWRNLTYEEAAAAACWGLIPGAWPELIRLGV